MLTDEPMTRHAAVQMVKRYARRAGLPELFAEGAVVRSVPSSQKAFAVTDLEHQSGCTMMGR
jgi:hypothetical protein